MQDLHRQPAGGKDDDNDDDKTGYTSFRSHRLCLLAGSLSAAATASSHCLREETADHGAVQQTDGDQRNEESECEERAVEDAGVIHVTVPDAFIGTR